MIDPTANSSFAEMLTPFLWRLPLPVTTLPPYDHTNSYVLLDADNRAFVVDMGSAEAADKFMAWLTERQGTLQGVVVTHTHSDHVAGLVRLLEHHPAPQAVPVYVHVLEQDRLRQYLANDANVQHLADGDTLHHDSSHEGSMHLTTLHTPGHSPGHLSFVVRQPDQPTVMLAGDMVTGDGAIWVGTPEGDVSAYVQSLARLQEVDADCLAASHGLVSWQPSVLINKARTHKEAREQQVLAALESPMSSLPMSSPPMSALDVTAQLYANVSDAMRDFAERSVQAHLAKLLSEGRIREVHDRQRGKLYQRHKLNP